MFKDAIFLANHPGWSPTDLATASEELLDAMAMIDAAVALRRKHDG